MADWWPRWARVRRPSAGTTAARPEAKASRAGALIAWTAHGAPQWTPRNYAALAREGFAQNAIAYRCVRLVADSAASVPLVLYEGGAEHDAHPLLDLLARPNPLESGTELREALAGYLLIAGNAYLEAVEAAGRPRELYALRPDRMRVVPGPRGWPVAYDYTAGGRTTRYPVDLARNVWGL